MMTESLEFDRVRANTDPEVLRHIDEALEARIRFYSTQPKERITERIRELEPEWDIERWLQTNASALALTGVVLSVVASRKWLLLTTGVLGFLFQHAVQGWCPPVPVLRRLGIRTQREIDREKYALKLLQIRPSLLQIRLIVLVRRAAVRNGKFPRAPLDHLRRHRSQAVRSFRDFPSHHF